MIARRNYLRVICAIGFAFSFVSVTHGITQSGRGGDFRFVDVSQTEKFKGFVPGGGSACWADFDGDSWVDLAAGGTIWRNAAGISFAKLAEGFGEVIAGDFDNDGRTDLFSWSQLQLFRNLDGKTFQAHPLPELPQTVSLGACWGDFNGDSLLDLFVGGYENWEAGITYPDLTLLQKPDHTFVLARTDDRYRARGVTACDYDEDGDLDIYVSNYRLQPNLLWSNDGRGVFSDVAAGDNALATSPGFEGGHSIGACWGDFNNDGHWDLFAGNFAHVDSRGDQPKSRFLKNLGPAGEWKFADLGPCGVFYQESYASPAAADFDNDTHLDLYFTTAYETASFKVRNQPTLFHRVDDFQFQDETEAHGLNGLPATYQAACADFDHDGDIDLCTAGKLFENQASNSSRWLRVTLKGDGRIVNRDAIGTQVRLKLGGQTLTRQVEAGTGQGNQNDLALHFGLADFVAPMTLEILWPNGQRQNLTVEENNTTKEIVFDSPGR